MPVVTRKKARLDQKGASIVMLTFTCPDKTCVKCFKTERGLSGHLAKSPGCAKALTKFAYCLPVGTNISQSQTETALETNADSSQELQSESEEPDDGAVNLIDIDNTSDNQESINIDLADDNNGNNNMEISIDNTICYTNEMLHQTKLMKILNDANAPLFLYQQIVEWAIETQESGTQFRDITKTRQGYINQMEKWMPTLKANAPYTVQAILETNTNPEYVEVAVFDFKKQLLSLLHDKSLFGSFQNLDINPKNPFGKYESEKKILSTVNSGHRYNLAYKTMINSPDTQFLMPIIFACDETKVSSQGKASCWPLIFTTSILNQEMRNKPSAWRPLGYIPDLSMTTSGNQEKQFGVHLKYNRLHQLLRTILASFVKCQNEPLLNNVTLNLGNQTKKVDLKIPCFYIIGDMQGGDKMACSSPCYSDKMQRLCRKCNVRGSDSGDPYVECKKFLMEPIKNMVLTNQVMQLDAINQYHVQNAWFEVDFGGCPYGIFSAACPVEPLHALENGLIADCLKVLFGKIKSSKSLSELDSLAKTLTELPRQRLASYGSDKDMPRLLWKDGITSLTDLTASCKVGIMFTIVVLSLQDNGNQFFLSVFGQARSVNDMRECFQMILCYWMWLKKDKYWKRKDKDSMVAAKYAIQQMLARIVDLWPRTTGQGWNLAKFHEQLHVPDDIFQNGAPSGSHSGPVEHGHIQMVKRPSQRTQKRRKTLDIQLAHRVYESYLVNTAYTQMQVNRNKTSVGKDKQPLDGPTKNASTGQLKIKLINGEPVAMYTKKSMKLNKDTLNFLVKTYCCGSSQNETTISYFSEYKQGDKLYRGILNYRGQGPWFDWAMIRWEGDGSGIQGNMLRNQCHIDYLDEDKEGGQYLYCPGQILCFVHGEADGYKAVVKCCEYRCTKGSVFSNSWKQAYIYPSRNVKLPYICEVDVQALVRHLLMVPNNSQGETYHEIWDRKLWSHEFN